MASARAGRTRVAAPARVARRKSRRVERMSISLPWEALKVTSDTGAGNIGPAVAGPLRWVGPRGEPDRSAERAVACRPRPEERTARFAFPAPEHARARRRAGLHPAHGHRPRAALHRLVRTRHHRVYNG